MQMTELKEVATNFISGLPENVTEALEEVELLICATPEKGNTVLKEELKEDFTENLPLDCKGVFVGSPLETKEENDEEEIVFYPEGYLVIIANNIKDKEEASLVLTHEIAHAMGWNEEEVTQMGLGVEKSTTAQKEELNVSTESS